MGTSPANPIVELEGIGVRFGETQIHHDVSLKLYPASVIALIGGSGSGKSVLLRTIIGLLRPSAGKVKLFGQDIWSVSEDELNALRNRVGVLFQNGALFSGLTVAQNIGVPLREHTKLPNELIKRVVDLRLVLSGLEASAGVKMPSELSGGMRKRAALARALALEPEVLFLDEPTSGLDPINARSFDKLVRTLCDGVKLTILMATHDLDTLESIVDRVIVLGEGRVLADGTVDDVAQVKQPWIHEYFSSRSK